MAKGHRSQIKRARNENNKETRPSAKLSYARISVQKACYVLDAIRGKDVQTALGILTYIRDMLPAFSRNFLSQQSQTLRTTTE